MSGQPEQPDDWLPAQLVGAARAHELYATYVAAGFTKDQAYGLIVVTLTEAQRRTGPGGA